ncbi:uncharacterized protein N7479_005337 [Penicillium vulpinum]|uniref:uncharacterized protein n=1 Tax=Penicillium vulpinum TaxID=29845 RepID=UPI002548E783|nr:uncharacterized protein N7479_005337 [Penicillium vulpinum]KAJ5958187.1 hypothetical protein N7479_005337 [Penicillium vulpinum]
MITINHESSSILTSTATTIHPGCFHLDHLSRSPSNMRLSIYCDSYNHRFTSYHNGTKISMAFLPTLRLYLVNIKIHSATCKQPQTLANFKVKQMSSTEYKQTYKQTYHGQASNSKWPHKASGSNIFIQ